MERKSGGIGPLPGHLDFPLYDMWRRVELHGALGQVAERSEHAAMATRSIVPHVIRGVESWRCFCLAKLRRASKVLAKLDRRQWLGWRS